MGMRSYLSRPSRCISDLTTHEVEAIANGYIRDVYKLLGRQEKAVAVEQTGYRPWPNSWHRPFTILG
jgi:hypothetical protein